jgi:cytochrome c-type biogenesis protein CcmH
LSVGESDTAAARAIQRQIVEQLAAGQSREEVRSYFVARYGDWILLAPSSPLAWWIPPLAILSGIAAFAWWLRRGTRTAAPPSPLPDQDARERIREEVEQLDA